MSKLKKNSEHLTFSLALFISPTHLFLLSFIFLHCSVPWQTEDTTLEDHFSRFGPVEEAQIMREKYTGKSRGFGFVTFASADDARRAVAAEHIVDNRRCEAKFALPEGKVGSARTTRIFAARIPSSVTDLQFRGYFEQFGAVQDAYMPKDPSKQGHRGIGFVTYASVDSVERVMAQNHILHGNEIAIDRATPKDKPLPGATGMLPGRLSMSQPNMSMLGGSGHGAGGALAALAAARAGGGSHHGGSLAEAAGHTMHHHHHNRKMHGGGVGQPVGSRSPQSTSRQGSLGSGGTSNLSLLAQAHAATLQQHLANNTLAGVDGGSPSQLISFLSASAAAIAAGTYRPHHLGSLHGVDSIPPGSATSSSNDLAGLLAQQHQDQAAIAAGTYRPQQHQDQAAIAAAAAWGAVGPTASGLRATSATAPQPSGPASARAGPRIFVGKLSRDTSEQDIKDYFTRFG
jgi:RNA-binding protein Musashi